MLKRIILCLILVLTPALLWAQSADLTGYVKDQTGAVVPNATVELRNQDTGVRQQTTTNELGLYHLVNVKPGNYIVTVQAQGFKTLTRDGIVLNVADRASMDLLMQVGQVSTTINVTEEAPLITQSSSVGTVINHHFVDNIPLNGRTFQALLALVPGIVPDTDSRQFYVNGQRSVSNSASIDGVSANLGAAFQNGQYRYATGSTMGFTATGTTQATATMEELQEFTVQTGGYGAELGRQSGAQISFATKSGTNQFHGSAFEYFRNEILDANDWFLNRQGRARPKLRQNDFGGTFGGPIVKNKTFFFLALEYDPLLTPAVGTTTVPTQAYKNAAAPAMLPLLNMYPLPNGAIAANGLSGAFLLSDSTRSPVSAESLKLDQNIGSRLTMFARYHRSPSRSASPYYPCSDMVSYTNTQTGTYGATWTVSPRMVDQVRFNWSRAAAGYHTVFNGRAGATMAPDSAIWPAGYSAANASIYMSISDSFSGGAISIGPQQKDIQRQYELSDSISLARGKHNISIGGDWRRLAPNIDLVNNAEFLYITNAASSQVRVSTSALSPTQFALNSLSLYAADAWKVSPRLTLNLGVRWEFAPPPHATSGAQPFAAQNFDPSNTAAATLAPQGTPIYKTRYNNFAPRLGAAWHAIDKPGRDTVVRGAFGVYYDMGVGDPMGFLSSAPYSRGSSAITATYPAILSNPAILAPALNLNPPFNILKLFDPNLRMPYTLSWNAGVQQSLGRNQSISADYVGNRGKRLLMFVTALSINNPITTPTGSLNETTNLAASWYDALQVQFNRRLSRGLQVLANYTLSRSDDTASDETAGSGFSSVSPVSTLRGPSNYDVRHNFTAAATWQIPAPFANRALKAALGGWSLNPLVRAYSAKPLNPYYNYLVTGVVNYTMRPDLVPGQPFWISDPSAPGGRKLNLAAFSVPTFTDPSQVRQGTAGRNCIRGWAATQQDLAVRRDFKVTERMGLQVSAEFYNIFNHPTFLNYGASLGSYINGKYSPPSTATFGLANSTLANAPYLSGSALPINAFGGQRDIQFSMKVSF